MQWQRIDRLVREPERACTRRDEMCARARVTAREQRHIVAERDELLLVRYDTIRSGTAIQRRRNTLVERRDLRDA